MEIDGNNKERYLFIETFGCQMNENDSERIIGVMRHLNYKTTDSPEKADIVILNTCSIRDKAEQKVYSALGRLKKLKGSKPGLVIGVGGCVAQQEGERLLKRAPHLDLVFGTHNIHRLPDLIKEVEVKKGRLAATEFFASAEQAFEDTDMGNAPYRAFSGVKAFVGIMKGCDNFCSYCIVPYVRGRELSRKSDAVLQEVRKLSENGVKEVTLIGQNVNSYGNRGGDISFTDLLRKACRVEGIERVRFITSHPKDMPENLIKLFGEEEKLCRHIHLPVQSGSNVILERMRRGYTRDAYLSVVYKLKRLYPDMGITTDIIVGFPGETESDFLETMGLIQGVEFDNIFSFKYSPRPETDAASFDGQVPEAVKEQRLSILQEAQREITIKKNQKMRGMAADVLIEGMGKTAEDNRANGISRLIGRTSCNKLVNLTCYPSCQIDGYIGRIVPVMIEGASPHCLTGFIIENEQERANICC